MEKLKMQSENLVNENIGKIAELFPNCVTEGYDNNGKLIKMVDFDLLKQELSDIVVEGNDERYTMTWPGKKQAILTANSPINATLRPCKEESVDFDNTQNLYIEGDNLDVLKLLRETYLNKVKMIYIDPPYNTGNDFVYEDDFATSAEEYLQASKSYDDQGNKLFPNNDSNGRFHSDWLSMMYSRLKLAKDLLANDGMIFISIDDHEIENLKKICDEIFGNKNFLLNICVNRTSEIAKNYTIFKHEYSLVYVKNINNFNLTTVEKISVSRGTVGNTDQTMPIIEFPAGLSCRNIPDGIYKETRKVEGSSENIENFDPIVIEQGKLKFPVKLKARWRSSNDMRNFFNNKCQPTPAKINGEIIEIYFENDKFNPQIKKKTYEKISSMYLKNKKGSEDIKKLNLDGCFDFPKSVSFIKYLLSFTHKEDIIMDFFSGSATTAHAVMQLNAEDGGKRKYICVQLPEKCDEKFEAYKAGYKNICEIAKERIRRAGNEIQKTQNELKHTTVIDKPEQISVLEALQGNEQVAFDFIKTQPKSDVSRQVDIGFRVLKLDSSCMKDIYYNPEDITQDLLTGLEDNIKEDRTPEDLLFQVMLDMGVLLSSKIEEKTINNKKVFIVGEYDNDSQPNLICCFDNDLTDDVVKEIAKMKPLYAVFRDSSIATDSVSVNFEQIFETYSPTTKRRVI